MVTNDNDEIKQKASEKEWDYSASFKDKADDYENYLMNEARADQKAWDKAQEEEYTEIAKRKARADTSKQIFNEIDEYVYVTGLSVKDKKADWFKEKYEALKKKYNIEE